MADLRQVVRTTADHPPVLCFHPAPVEAGETFFGDKWPEVRAVADQELQVYAAFGLARGKWSKITGLRTVMHGLRALRRGYFPGRPVGSVRAMAGMFLVRGKEILWQLPFAENGHHPDMHCAVEAARALQSEPPR